MADDLTILLTLKDRAAFTLRWMSYANSIRFPFRVLIADGGADENVTRVLSDNASFPHVDFEYLRYPYDQTYADYYAKIVDALARVRTPFVAMADNDDFFIVEGLRQALEFLRTHADYAACGGQSGVFWITPSPGLASMDPAYGSNVEPKWRPCPPPIDGDTAAERIQSQFSNYYETAYYDVQRTEEAAGRFAKLKALDLHDLFLAEYLLALLVGVAGKVRRIKRLSLLRQRNTPERSGQDHQERYGDAFARMLTESWSGDFAKVVNTVAEALAARDGMTIEDARSHVRHCYRLFVAPVIIENLIPEPTVSKTMPLAMKIVHDIVKLAPDSRVKRLLRAIYRRVPWISLTAVNGEDYLVRPLPTYKTDFAPIAEFVTGKPRTPHA